MKKINGLILKFGEPLERIKTGVGSKVSYVYKYHCILCKENIVYLRFSYETCVCKKCSDKSKTKRPFERAYNHLVYSSGVRLIPIDLTYEQYVVIRGSDKCHYCNDKMLVLPYKDTGSWLDRKDNNVGYTLSNVVVCCTECNKTKNAYLSYDEMILVCNYRKSKLNGTS